jgi:DNA invertase Pin-like site-specific DNA recombinase
VIPKPLAPSGFSGPVQCSGLVSANRFGEGDDPPAHTGQRTETSERFDGNLLARWTVSGGECAAEVTTEGVRFTHTTVTCVEKYLAYYRVSTARQGRSGLGLEAQKTEVERFLTEEGAELVGELVEVVSGKDESNRPRLQEALTRCKNERLTLCVAKLCRLSRDAAFVLTLMKDSKVRFRVASMPQADNFQLGIWAVLNQQEREMISRRTREALAAAKSRGVRLGGTGGAHQALKVRNQNRKQAAEEFALSYGVLVEHLRSKGETLREIAETLNAMGSQSPQGFPWTPTTVHRVIRRYKNQFTNDAKHTQ